MSLLLSALDHFGGAGLLAGVLLLIVVWQRKDAARDRATFARELKAERDQCHADHERIMLHLAKLADAVRDRR